MNSTRRSMMTSALALGAMQLFPGITKAQAKRIVFATFTGSWEEAHRDVLVPAYRKATSNAEIVLDPMLSVDQIAKVTAARANPPIDVMLHDPGPALVAIAQRPDRAVSGRQERLLQGPDRRGAGAGRSGDLLPGGRAHLQSRQGQDAADLVGGSVEARVQGQGRHHQSQFHARHRLPGRDRAHEWRLGSQHRAGLQGDRGAEAYPRRRSRPIPGQLATLFQQGQIDISPGNFNAIQIMKARGVAVEFVAPKEKAIAFKTTIHIVKNTRREGSGIRADRGRDVARGAGEADGQPVSDRADQHQGEDGRRNRQGRWRRITPT